MTSDYVHLPVMVAEVLAALGARVGGQYVDGTLGGGGMAAALLAASAPSGKLMACDRDAEAIEAAWIRLAPFAGRFEIRQANFADLAAWVPAQWCDGILFDLGLSSRQVDAAERGFSFQQEGPLDMRMDQRAPVTAASLINEASDEELAKIFWELGGERDARRFARAVVREREQRPFQTTRQLAELIERLAPRRGSRTHPATRVFSGLRRAVNDEVGSLQRGLAAAVGLLKPGGRLAVITFDSVDDRIVKAFGREQARDYSFAGPVDVPELRQPRRPELKWVTRKALKPGAAEVAANPRSRSAQLRVLERMGDAGC